MQLGIVTLFPQMFNALKMGICGRALEQKMLEMHCWNPRDFTSNTHKTVDDRPYGGGPGMVMMFDPLQKSIHAAKRQLPLAQVLCLSPQGRTLDQELAQNLAKQDELILVCGRYEGIDERLIETEIDLELSIGDYVLSGGEIPAMVVVDTICRLIPGVLGHDLSAEQDSFAYGLLDCPHYTRPIKAGGINTPAVLTSGNHAAIERWRLKQALGRTWQRRPDLLANRQLTTEEETLLNEFKAEL